jgi:hypothetical protein
VGSVRRWSRGAALVVFSSVLVLGSLLSPGGVAHATSVQVACGAGADLQAAIDAAPVGATLQVSGTCVGNFIIDKDLALQGPPSLATLDGAGTGTTVRINSGTVQLDQLFVTGGHGDGGGIDNYGTLTVRRTIVRGNTVVGSQCSDCGGGILSWGPLTLDHSRVTENRAEVGGGIFSLDRLTIVHSLIGWNAGSHYSAAAIEAFNGPTSIIRSRVIGNRGGFTAVNIVTGVGTVAGSRFIGNRTSVALTTGDDGTFVTHSTISGTHGDGIFNDGRLTLVASTIDDNAGTGVNNAGWGAIRRSTISGNTGNLGGGISNIGELSIVWTTVVGNTASKGGGLFDYSGATIMGSILAGNSATEGADCFVPSYGTGSTRSNGYNIAGADCGFSAQGDQVVSDDMASIGIEPLAFNGGPTRTMALLATSPAVDWIPVGAVALGRGLPLCPSSGKRDQRGVLRPQGPACDVGAYELVP